MIYIVISENTHYPMGLSDWRCVTGDLTEAEHAYKNATGDHVALVKVTPDGYTVLLGR